LPGGGSVSGSECGAIPAGLINTAGAVVGRFSPMVKDLTAMMRWFQTGRYVADPTRQREVFGQVPTAEDAITRFVRSLRPVGEAA